MALSDEATAGVGAAVGVGTAVAQGGLNPVADISAAMSVIGLGMSIFGTNKSADASKQMAQTAQAQANASSQIFTLDQQANAQRKQQMVLTANRQQLETIRNTQRARSAALTTSTSQGAQFGSGLQGGYGQISGDENTNLLGVNQNLAIGQNLFGINDLVDQQKIVLAQLGAKMATLQGNKASGDALSGLGGAVSKSSGQVGQLGGNVAGKFDSSTQNNWTGIYTGSGGTTNTPGWTI